MMIWTDTETTGLEDQVLDGTGKLLEVALIITGDHLEFIAETCVVVQHDPGSLVGLMPELVLEMHTSSGLLDRVFAGPPASVPIHDAELALIDFLIEHAGPAKLPLCGSTVQFDRLWLKKFMPDLESCFHYRNIDISTVKELQKIWRPDLTPYPTPNKKAHRATDDIRATLGEAQFYHDGWLA